MDLPLSAHIRVADFKSFVIRLPAAVPAKRVVHRKDAQDACHYLMNNVPTWSPRLLRGAPMSIPPDVCYDHCDNIFVCLLQLLLPLFAFGGGRGGHSLMWGRGGVIFIKHMLLIKKLHEKVKILRVVRGGWGVKDKNIRIFFWRRTTNALPTRIHFFATAVLSIS